MTVGLMQDSKAYPASRLTSEARKPRTCITPTMLAVLQRCSTPLATCRHVLAKPQSPGTHTVLRFRSAFDMHMGHPSNEARQRLANQLHMSPKSVQVWFQNRRQKLRGQQQATIIAAASNESAVVVRPVVQRQIDMVQQQIDDADRRETVHPYAMQATPRVAAAQRYEESAAAYEPGAGAATAMHPAQGYSLPRPGDFQTTTLPAHILSELASVSAAEQDLAHFARQLMQRKVELLDNIQRLEQQSAASRHGGHAVSVSPAYLATQAVAPLADFAAYKKYKEFQEAHETLRPSEPYQASRTTSPCAPSPITRSPATGLFRDASPLLTVTFLHAAGARGAAPVRGLRRPGVLLALPAVRVAADRLAGSLATARLANAFRYASGQGRRRVGRYAPLP